MYQKDLFVHYENWLKNAREFENNVIASEQSYTEISHIDGRPTGIVSVTTIEMSRSDISQCLNKIGLYKPDLSCIISFMSENIL